MLIQEKMQMQTIQLKTIVGEDGILQIQIPPEFKHKSLEVLVVFQLLVSETQMIHPQGWPSNFFDKTWGSCSDDPIIMDDQGISIELDDDLVGLFD